MKEFVNFYKFLLWKIKKYLIKWKWFKKKLKKMPDKKMIVLLFVNFIKVH